MPDDATREHLGRAVRQAWIKWAREQPNPKPSWLLPWEELAEPDREADRRIGEALASITAEHCAQAITAHMEAHGPRKPRGALEPVLDTGRTYRTWRRHMGIAARIAAGAFMTDKDRLQMAADALRRGDFAVCPPPEGSSAVADRERCVYCGKKDYEPGWGCHTCGTATVEDVRNG